MKKILRKTLMLLMVMTMMGSTLITAEAAEQITSPYIKILKPAQASTYYQGETMSYQFSIKNPFSSWYCRPFAGIMSTSNKLIYAAQGTYMAIGSSAKPTGSGASGMSVTELLASIPTEPNQLQCLLVEDSASALTLSVGLRVDAGVAEKVDMAIAAPRC